MFGITFTGESASSNGGRANRSEIYTYSIDVTHYSIVIIVELETCLQIMITLLKFEKKEMFNRYHYQITV